MTPGNETTLIGLDGEGRGGENRELETMTTLSARNEQDETWRGERPEYGRSIIH